MSSSIFLSYPRPYLKKQEEFIERITHYLEERYLQPRTLGVTDYDMDAPLTAIRSLMLESNGLVTIAFRRALIKKGTGKPSSDIGQNVEQQRFVGRCGESWLEPPTLVERAEVEQRFVVERHAEDVPPLSRAGFHLATWRCTNRP